MKRFILLSISVLCIALNALAQAPGKGGRKTLETTYFYFDNGHGTHVAGILAGNGFASKGKICGMAPMASLYILKILDFNGDGDTRDVVAALDWLIANHEEKNIKLLNFSHKQFRKLLVNLLCFSL